MNSLPCRRAELHGPGVPAGLRRQIPGQYQRLGHRVSSGTARCYIEKSCEGIYAGDQVHDSFQRLARVVDSRIIISHIRCPKAGHQKESQAQPLSASFWTITGCSALPGSPRQAMAYPSPRPILAEELLAARVFEFVRDGMEAGMRDWPEQSLYQSSGRDLQEADHRLPRGVYFFSGQRNGAFRLPQPRPGAHLPPAGGPGGIPGADHGLRGPHPGPGPLARLH